MMAYKIMLLMIIFSAVCGGLNTLGWYSTVSLPATGAGISQAQVTELTKSVGQTSVNAWTIYTVLGMCFNVLGSCLLNLLSIIPLLTAFGVALPITLMIQTPIWLVLAIAVYELWTGHVLTMQE
jgi:hypothetical protein